MQTCWDFMKCGRGPERPAAQRCIAAYYPAGSCFLVAGNWSLSVRSDCVRNQKGGYCADCSYFTDVVSQAPVEQAAACWKPLMSRWLGEE